jgi:hypothetical protein
MACILPGIIRSMLTAVTNLHQNKFRSGRTKRKNGRIIKKQLTLKSITIMPVVWKDYREESRTLWGTKIEQDKPIDRESITLGAILRIADATELMALNYTKLQTEAEKYKRWYDRECEVSKGLAKRVSALQGVITRIKKKAK